MPPIPWARLTAPPSPLRSDEVPPPTVTIAATDATATEAGLTTGTFTVSRTGSTTAALTVHYSVSGTATAGSDYTALSGSCHHPHWCRLRHHYRDAAR